MKPADPNDKNPLAHWTDEHDRRKRMKELYDASCARTFAEEGPRDSEAMVAAYDGRSFWARHEGLPKAHEGKNLYAEEFAKRNEKDKGVYSLGMAMGTKYLATTSAGREFLRAAQLVFKRSLTCLRSLASGVSAVGIKARCQ